MSTATQLLTAEELFRLPEDETGRCELVDGEIIQMSPPGAMHGIIAAELTSLLQSYVRRHRLGVALAEAGFIVSRNPDTVLAPDGAFIRQARIDAIGVSKAYFPEPPALVLEVVSPRDTVSEVAEKMRRWMTAGVELGWVVDPGGRTVTVYHSSDDISVLTGKDVITGGEVVPGFECRVADLFAGL